MALNKLDHVLVLTDDMERTRDFYRDALGLEVGDRPPLEFPGYWLYAEGVPCVHVADRDADHLAFSGDDHDEAVARLERTGVEARRNTGPGIRMRQLFFEDPNGVKIEINVMPAEGDKEE